MLALYRSGRQADALAAYRDVRRVLLDELGLQPGRALQELEQAILRHEPDLDLEASDQASPEEPEQPPSTPLPVSREGRRTVTAVFFAITTASRQGERLDPEALRHITAQAFDELQDAVERHGGTVEAITAAGLSAIFGLPIVHEDDALRALRAADEARTRLTQIAVQLADTHPARLAVTVGVGTGEVMAGGRSLGRRVRPVSRLWRRRVSLRQVTRGTSLSTRQRGGSRDTRRSWSLRRSAGGRLPSCGAGVRQ